VRLFLFLTRLLAAQVFWISLDSGMKKLAYSARNQLMGEIIDRLLTDRNQLSLFVELASVNISGPCFWGRFFCALRE
jgi:hypothetical protein